MTQRRNVSRPVRSCISLVVGLSLLIAGPARAEKAVLADGRVLDGRFAKLSGIAVNPLANGGGQAANAVNHILMCDDDLRRTMVGLREVIKVDAVAPQRIEHFMLKQPVLGNGAPVASLGAITEVGDWDPYGHRIFSMIIGGKVTNVIQGLTEITPSWSKAEVIQGGANLLWDMRIATSSIPRDRLNKILSKQIDPKNPDHRLKLVRFYMQAERYADADAELQQVIKDFKNIPNLPGLAQQEEALRKLSAQLILNEVEVRRKAGQYGLADQMLRKFPTDNVPGATLEEVRDKIEKNDKIVERLKTVIAQLDEQIGKVKDSAIRRQIKPLRDEIQRDLFVATLDRLAPFARLADDPDLLPEQKLALAISGWLLGPNDAVDNLQTALSLAETRNIIRAYLAEPLKINRDPLIESLGSQQGASPKLIAELLDHMKPPIVTPEPETPGFDKLEIRGLAGEPDVTYFVQLPPEYDPYIKYPTIVTLNAAGTSPELQIDWWAGAPPEAAKNVAPAIEAEKRGAACGGAIEEANIKSPEKPQPQQDRRMIRAAMRKGQATRHGYIVIAPAWTKPHQIAYEYSNREYAAVVGALHDALRRFSIDTDRVFLSGHSMGGDAAWDIGLAHPDLWAGVIPIVATSGKFIERYWQNAERVPFYFVAGEMDGNKTVTNGPQLDRYYLQAAKDQKLWDITYVEYQGRGHENFSDEILRIFDWMGRKRRDFFPKEFKAVTMRSWDNSFWCVDLSGMPGAQMIDPTAWPPPRSILPFTLEFKANPNNGINVPLRNARATVWLSPELVNFDRPIDVTIGGARVGARGAIKPSIPVMLEDARTRADRQHPFWAKVER